CWTYEEEYYFRSNFLQQYNKDIRPLNDLSKPISVGIHLEIAKMNDFNLAEGRLKIQTYLILQWYDEKIFWNESTYPIPKLMVSSKKIWSPAISVYYTENEMDSKDQFQMEIYKNGSVHQWKSFYFNILCDVNARAFPFDKYTCETMFYFNDYDIQTAIFSSFRCISSTDLSRKAWYVSFSCDTKIGEEGSLGQLSLKLVRKVSLQCLSVLLPLFIFFILNIMIGYLPIESGEKVTFATTVFLSNVIYIDNLSKQLPKESSEIPLIFLCHIFLAFLSGLSAVGTIITSKIFCKYKSTESAPSPSPAPANNKIDVKKNSQIYSISKEGRVEKEANSSDGIKATTTTTTTTITEDLKKICLSYAKIESAILYIMTFISILCALVFTSLFFESFLD
uniref:Squid sensory receptor CRB1 n=1 Tax=Sepioloidea lineolata TaxID=61742 RepID=UPI002418140B|nr:Chain A, Squid sensory receptor CRB1 [Sepioloidea lineolata]8EIZ_B Chain B, Squid sensory receptor CRB1 [Sepioloidea lineolata]8EIZ_C Chain C, Squid sensory receptor CRB1 [Sepioloidea lineolata]8EIZ_D Chain D, Squid sensory receptor CRB1 [Sepioloidea lineolata]8EIZ_E Chain E, Squid sensory receptor CRB1 [Sepioloidea lineolata]